MSQEARDELAGGPLSKCADEACVPISAAGRSSHWQAFLLRQGDRGIEQLDDEVVDHNVDWLLAQCDQAHKAVLVLRDDSGRVVPLFVHDGQVDIGFGSTAVCAVKIRRHVLVGNFPESPPVDWSAAMNALAEMMPSNGAAFLLGVVRDEGLGQALVSGALKRSFFVCEHGAEYARRLCVLGNSLDEYLASLPAKSRQDLRRSIRRFESNFAGRFEFSTSCSTAEVTDFLNRVEAVSKRTYQARQHGLGIVADSYIGNKVIEGALRGYARCYLLTVDGQPVAWRIGFLFNEVYASHHVGYDPDFEKWHPGVVLHLHSVRDLSENFMGVHTLDMLYGDNDFKRKASNLSRIERNYYLFPRTPRGWATSFALRSFNGLSGLIGWVLDRAGVKVAIRRWLRRA